jgi:hypothetical protein
MRPFDEEQQLFARNPLDDEAILSGRFFSVPLHTMALTERLNARPVRLVFDWLSDIFGRNNPWFSEEFRLNNAPSEYDVGLRKMFNLGGYGQAAVAAETLPGLKCAGKPAARQR